MVTEMHRRTGIVWHSQPPDGQPASSSPLHRFSHELQTQTAVAPIRPVYVHTYSFFVGHGDHPRLYRGRLLVRKQHGPWGSSWKRDTILGERCVGSQAPRADCIRPVHHISFARPVRWADQSTPRSLASGFIVSNSGPGGVTSNAEKGLCRAGHTRGLSTGRSPPLSLIAQFHLRPEDSLRVLDRGRAWRRAYREFPK